MYNLYNNPLRIYGKYKAFKNEILFKCNCNELSLNAIWNDKCIADMNFISLLFCKEHILKCK